jgi:3-deoxy-D-arabino-heptulosonate 7-phosphate (DAHP) synthase class II
VSKKEALEILQEVKDNVNVCCAITMEPDEVLDLIDQLEEFIQNS